MVITIMRAIIITMASVDCRRHNTLKISNNGKYGAM